MSKKAMIMDSNSNEMLKRANPSTIQDKFLVGYQGWFTCPGDGEPVDPGHHGWLHWFNYPIPDGGRTNTDVWPDVSSYSPSELFPAPGLKTAAGEQTFLFSSRNPKSVQRHFHWMARHGVDGAFLQRFAGQCDLESGNEGIRRIRDEVGERVREAAEQEGRVFAIMYDVSGVPPDRIQRVLERDWIHLVHNLGVLDSPSYLKERGKPVVALWGFGFDNAGHTPDLVRAITQSFRNATPGGVYIMGGAPAHWRTAQSDADRNPEFLDVWLNEFDAISPWTVGRYRTEQDADNFAETKMKGDSELIKKRNEVGRFRKVDYIPVVLPGGSGYNLSEGKWGFNDIKRQGGKFLWRQIYNARRLGVRTMYGAMWDEYDEGTAFMPIVEHDRDLPVSDRFHFLSLEADGIPDIPSDWYMRICGLAAEGLRNERPILETFPKKELDDYWSSRPRYEDVNPKTKEISTGSSSSSSSSAKAGNSGGVDREDGQTYQEWLALQNEEKDELPPPPYTLEVDELTDPIASSQSLTNVDTRAVAPAPVAAAAAAATAIATTSEVAPVVANVQAVASSSHATASSSHVIASSSHAIAPSSHTAVSPRPPPVNKNTYPTPAAPVSQAYSPVSAPSPQGTNVHSPQPYPPAPSGVHHSQSRPPTQIHSPQSYPVSQSHIPPRAHSPQPFAPTQVTQSYAQQLHSPAQVQAPQPFPPTAGQYAIAQGQGHPVPSQAGQSYLPSSSAQSPHSYGSPLPQRQSPDWTQRPQVYAPAGGSFHQGYTTGHSQGGYNLPPGAPSQGYISPNAQPAQTYPTSEGPVRQGYRPPVDQPSFQGYTSNQNTSHMMHNQSQDVINTLTNDFGRQSISGPGRVPPGGCGDLPTPPPTHPSHTGSSGYHSFQDSGRPSISGPSGGAGGRLPSPPPLHPAHAVHSASRPPKPAQPRPSTTQSRPTSQSQSQPHSQSGHHSTSASSPTSNTASSESSTPVASTQNRPRWPPENWDSDEPPVLQFSSNSGRKPSAVGGANLTRPQTISASSNKPSGGSTTLRPTSSLSNRPSSRPNTSSSTNMPSVEANTHDYSNHYGGPPIHGQPGSPMGFPSGPQQQYNSSSSSYTPSNYPGQQGGSTYESGVHGSAWPESGLGGVSPPHGSSIVFPGSQMPYGSGPGSPYGSQYPGGPAFPTESPTGGGGMQFPQGPGGDEGYYGNDMGSSSLPPFPNAQGYGGAYPPSGPYSQPSAGPWTSTGQPIHQYQGPPTSYPSSSSARPSYSTSSSAFLGRLENQVDILAQSSSKLFSKFTR